MKFKEYLEKLVSLHRESRALVARSEAEDNEDFLYDSFAVNSEIHELRKKHDTLYYCSWKDPSWVEEGQDVYLHKPLLREEVDTVDLKNVNPSSEAEKLWHLVPTKVLTSMGDHAKVIDHEGNYRILPLHKLRILAQGQSDV